MLYYIIYIYYYYFILYYTIFYCIILYYIVLYYVNINITTHTYIYIDKIYTTNLTRCVCELSHRDVEAYSITISVVG